MDCEVAFEVNATVTSTFVFEITVFIVLISLFTTTLVPVFTKLPDVFVTVTNLVFEPVT